MKMMKIAVAKHLKLLKHSKMLWWDDNVIKNKTICHEHHNGGLDLTIKEGVLVLDLDLD